MNCKQQIEAFKADPLRMRRLRRRTRRAGIVLFGIARAVFLFCLCLVLLYPLLVMLSISLRLPSELYDPTVVWIPKHFTLENYSNVIEKLDLGRIFGNTAIITVAGTACQLIAVMLAGYGFARFTFPGKKLLFGLLILTILVPPQVVSIPTMMYFQQFDLFGLGQIARLFTGSPFTVTLSNTYWAYLLPAILGRRYQVRAVCVYFHPVFPRSAEGSAGCGGDRRLRPLPHVLADHAALVGGGGADRDAVFAGVVLERQLFLRNLF